MEFKADNFDEWIDYKTYDTMDDLVEEVKAEICGHVNPLYTDSDMRSLALAVLEDDEKAYKLWDSLGFGEHHMYAVLNDFKEMRKYTLEQQEKDNY